MASGQWITLNGGDAAHSCILPISVEDKPYGTMLQKRHAGSVWECECKLKYEWLGKKWGNAK